MSVYILHITLFLFCIGLLYAYPNWILRKLSLFNLVIETINFAKFVQEPKNKEDEKTHLMVGLPM